MDTDFLQKHLDAAMERAVRTGELPAAQLLVFDGAREFYHGAVGWADLDKKTPQTRKTIYRMFSSSKEVTGFAAAICVERGLFCLEDRVEAFLPGFRDVRVGPERRPAARPMYVRDLLCMTSGLTYDAFWDETTAGTGTVDFANALGRRGLAFDPGARWQYGYSADVVGALVEVASGRRFGAFLREEIFDKLGMEDTAFFVPPGKRDRLCTPYWLNPETHRYVPHVERIGHLGVADWDAPPAFESGGAGLFSTVDDFEKWERCMLAGGVAPSGERLLSPAAFRAMTSGLLTARQRGSFDWDNCDGHQYGYFHHVQLAAPHGQLAAPGAFSWGGWMGTNTWCDPGHGLCGVFMAQSICTGANLFGRIRNVIGAAAER